MKARWLVLSGLAAMGMGAATLPCLAAGAPTITIEDDRGRTIHFETPPQRIITLMPAHTETICALGACERLVGTDRFSTWPASVQALPKLGGLEDTPLERVVQLKPDVVIAPKSGRLNGRLESLGVRVVALEPTSLKELARTIDALSRMITGDSAKGQQMLQGFEQRVQAARARIPAAYKGQSVYYEVASNPYAAGQSSFIGEILQRLDLQNIVPASMGPFPQLNPEFVIRAQPYLIMGSRNTIADMPRRAGWAHLQALKQNRTCGFTPQQGDVMVRPGPRLAEAADIVVDCLTHLPPR